MREMRNELNWPPAVRRAGGGALGRIGALGLLAVLLTVSGCAQQKPATQLELVPAKLLEPAPPAPPPESVLDQQPDDIKAAIEDYTGSHQGRVLHDGITTLFPYDANSQPVLECKPLRVTDITLAPGESVKSVAAGDTERWIVTPMDEAVLVKPKAPGIYTNLIILTDRHSYRPRLANGTNLHAEGRLLLPTRGARGGTSPQARR